VAADTKTAFVSYSRVDSEFAMRLAEDLKAAGASVWLDQLDIEPGTPWDSAIEEALLKSTHMLVVLSSVSVTSDNVRDEISYALSQQMKVIPVLYRECKVPFRLARLQHIDFRNDYDAALKALLKTLRVEQQATPSHSVPAASHEDKASFADAAEAQRKDEENRLQAQRAEHLAQQAQWEEERQQQLAQKAKWEEEQRLREQAESVRQAEIARQAEGARQAEMAHQAEATRLAEAERQRAAAELASQKIRQEQQAKDLAAQNAPLPTAPVAHINPSAPAAPQPRIQSNQSTPYLFGRIAVYALVAGLLRAICSFASALLARPFGYRLAYPISAILIGGITGLILYRVLLLFKPELSKKQVSTILWIWLVKGIALAALGWNPLLARSPLAILIFVLPTAIAGAITGRTVARALQNARANGIVIGIISFAIPAFLGQILLQILAYGHSASYYTVYGFANIMVSFCVATIEVGLLLWFIRNWGRPQSTQSITS